MSNLVSALGLTLDDRDPQAIFDAMAAKWTELVPDADLRNGSPEALLFEAVATASADSIYAANRVVASLVDAVLAIIGAPHDAGQRATGIVTITLDGTRSGSVEVGTQMTANGIDLEVTTTTSYSSVSSVAVPVRCADPGSAGNALTVGTSVTLDDLVPYAAAAAVTTSFTGGADPETDTAYRARVGHVFARLSSSLVLPEHVAAYAMEDARMARATAISLWNGVDTDTIGDDLGHMTAVVYGKAGELDEDALDELRRAMQAIIAAGFTMHAINAQRLVQPVTLAVHPETGAVEADVIAAVEAALSEWLSPTRWEFGETIRVNEIIAKAAAVAGVDYVAAVTVPSADVSLAAYELAAAGAITVTVV